VNPIDEKVKQIVGTQLGVNPFELMPTTSFVDDLGADTHDVLMLRLALENAFLVEIDDSEQFHNVGQAVAYFANSSSPQT
jgi:acyl carrier protein